MGAMEQEIGLLRREIQNPSHEELGMRQYTSGQLFGREVVVVFSRWGKVASASTVTTLIERYGVDLVLFTGVAGAASPELKVGDVVIATETVQHDMDARPLPGFSRFDVPLIDISRFPVEPRLIKLAKNSAATFIDNHMLSVTPQALLERFNISQPSVVEGLIATGDQFIADSNKVDGLSEALKGLKCLEMEGGAVAQVCYEHKVPMVLLRVISDTANQDATVDFPAFVQEVACPITCGIVEELIKQV